MPTNPCRTKELDLALDAARIAWERYVLARKKLHDVLEAIRGDHAADVPELVASLGEVVELAGQVFEALEQGPKIGGLVASLGKAVSMIAERYGAEASAQAKQRERRAQLLTAMKELELELRDFANRREAARALFETYWACTERMRPRQLELAVETAGTARGGLATARLLRTWRAKTMLTPKDPPGQDTFYARFLRWLADPTLTEELVGEGDVESAMPKHDWAASRPDVKVRANKPVFTGGPLRAAAYVVWHRADPARLSLAVRASGEQRVTLRVAITVQGKPQQIGGDQDVGQLLRQQLLVHRLGGKRVAAKWDPGQRVFRSESRKDNPAGHSECRVLLRPAGSTR